MDQHWGNTESNCLNFIRKSLEEIHADGTEVTPSNVRHIRTVMMKHLTKEFLEQIFPKNTSKAHNISHKRIQGQE